MEKPNKFLGVILLVFIGFVASVAVIYTKNINTDDQTANTSDVVNTEQTQEAPRSVWEIIEPASEKDHILGNPGAKLTLVGYFDINCGHCIDFHKTSHQLIEKYGKTGELRWIPRHFPLNPVSQKEAIASECAAKLRDNATFWSYLDALMENLAAKLEINRSDFKNCLEDPSNLEKVNKTRQEAISLGAKGTPFAILVNSQGKAAMIPGALPFEEMEKLIEAMLLEE